eukprot:CAMPEP_0181192768 /NCGR_PEP_ID=MMETSP1096-20121128/13459_1 /TAXON_ID=156174 ORGANISM="Chrysochromulina ericina, Strain CCMP281" /NCGR_SAMPLE_ID=MMETSP1096 /ASSEMBLY_ACC=CAM_ASM_000453 /LENGTH=183 /DNA_ID=CAMNT_0023282185 /DNA_START=668 /DNA_END=1220 /DNA_ORIENTATION=+
MARPTKVKSSISTGEEALVRSLFIDQVAHVTCLSVAILQEEAQQEDHDAHDLWKPWKDTLQLARTAAIHVDAGLPQDAAIPTRDVHVAHMKDSKSHQGTARLSARTVACRRLLKMTLLSSVWGGKSSEPVRVHAMTNAVQGTSVLALADNGAAGEPSSAEAPAAELMMELNATAAPPGDAFSQ